MKARTTSARLAIIGYGTLTLLASVTVSACSGSSPPSAGASFSPGGTISGSPSPGSTDTATASESPSASPSDTSTAPASPSPSPSPSPQAVSPFPAVAPATGGGGTAGLQHVLLFVLGGAALLAGAGSLAYRRRVVRNR